MSKSVCIRFLIMGRQCYCALCTLWRPNRIERERARELKTDKPNRKPQHCVEKICIIDIIVWQWFSLLMVGQWFNRKAFGNHYLVISWQWAFHSDQNSCMYLHKKKIDISSTSATISFYRQNTLLNKTKHLTLLLGILKWASHKVGYCH